jgi:hypothetical protein
MASRSIGAEEHEKVGETIQRGTVIGGRAIIFGPVLSDINAITPDNIHIRNESVGLESCGKDNHVGWDEAFVGLDTFGNNALGFSVCQKNFIAMQRLEVARVKDSPLLSFELANHYNPIRNK